MIPMTLMVGMVLGLGLIWLWRRRQQDTPSQPQDTAPRSCPRCKYVMGYAEAPCPHCEIHPQPHRENQ